jgi:fatty-acyl-CoA synthase
MTATPTPLVESYWPPEPSDGVRDITVGGLLREAVAAAPDRLALVDAVSDPTVRRQWTYVDMLADVERVAHALLARFERGDRIAIWAPNAADWVILQQGIAMAGMVMVAVNPAYRAHELQYVLVQSRSVALFRVDSYRDVELAPIVAEVRPQAPALREVISFTEWAEFLASGDPASALPEVAPLDPVQIQYTSGTTGFPKGALLHHKGLVNEASFVAERAGMADGAVCVNAMPMYHIGGGAVTEFGTLAVHGTYVVVPAFDPGLILEVLESYSGTHSLMVPTMLIAVLEHPDSATRDLSSVQAIMSGASAVPEALVHRVMATWDCRFSILFGQTEMHGVISQTRITDAPADQAATVGQPLPELEVKIADPATGQVLPTGEQGEICCRGYQTMLSYFELPEETSAAIDDGGWLHMGDLGTMDDRGYLKVTGRLKDMIIRGGINIYPREIEELLFSHPQITDVAVIGVPDEKWGELVTAVIRPADPSAPPIADELQVWCKARIAAHKVPSSWFSTQTYPMTPSGKVQKFVLRDQVDAGELQPLPAAARANAV